MMYKASVIVYCTYYIIFDYMLLLFVIISYKCLDVLYYILFFLYFIHFFYFLNILYIIYYIYHIIYVWYADTRYTIIHIYIYIHVCRVYIYIHEIWQTAIWDYWKPQCHPATIVPLILSTHALRHSQALNNQITKWKTLELLLVKGCFFLYRL